MTCSTQDCRRPTSVQPTNQGSPHTTTLTLHPTLRKITRNFAGRIANFNLTQPLTSTTAQDSTSLRLYTSSPPNQHPQQWLPRLYVNHHDTALLLPAGRKCSRLKSYSPSQKKAQKQTKKVSFVISSQSCAQLREQDQC